MINIAVTNGRARTPEEWASMATAKIVSVSENAPEPIRAQAEAFKTNVNRVIQNYIEMALQEQLSTFKLTS